MPDAPWSFWLFSLPLGSFGIVAMAWVVLTTRWEGEGDEDE